MPSFVPTSADTLEDQRLYTRARLVEVLVEGIWHRGELRMWRQTSNGWVAQGR